MKLLDKYIIKNFLVGYVVAFCVLMGLRIIIDLFVNLDEFTEHTTDLGTVTVVKNILIFYGLNATLYFRDFAGMIMVVAAAFSLGRMIRSNELVAVLASGVSLKRVIFPIIIVAIILTGILVIDQEFIIPPLGDKLVRSHDDIPGRESYNVKFISDENSSLIFSQRFDVETKTLDKPTILLRNKIAGQERWEVIGRISADKAVYDTETGNWDMVNGRLIQKDSQTPVQLIPSYKSDLTARNIPIKCKSENKNLLSWRQLRAIASQPTKLKDQAALYSQIQFHLTEPLINLVMLMISLPILVCRDPKAMKTATMISFGITGACLMVNFACKLLATEAIFQRVMPEFWAWLPILIFLPIAIFELDSMKT